MTVTDCFGRRQGPRFRINGVLCTDSERALWARLTVFPKDLDVEAAEEICCGDGLASEAVLDALARQDGPGLLAQVRELDRDAPDFQHIRLN